MKIEIDLNEDYDNISVLIKAPEMTTEVAEMMANLKVKKEQTIVGTIGEKMYVLKPKEILLFYTQGSKVIADTMDESYEIKNKLYQIEDVLKDYSFVRISKSAIVNIHKIKNIEIYFNGSLLTKFENGKEEVISRRYVSKVKECIGLGGK